MRNAFLLLLLGGCATPGIPARSVALTPEFSGSAVSDSPGEFTFARAFAPSVHGAYRWGAYGLGGGLELNVFRQQELDGGDDFLAAALIGVEGDMLSLDGRVRSRIGGGLAVLLEGTDRDEPGLTGFYVDIRPGGYRFLIAEDTLLTFDPLSLAILLPDASGIPLVDVQYRANVSVEFSL